MLFLDTLFAIYYLLRVLRMYMGIVPLLTEVSLHLQITDLTNALPVVRMLVVP